MGFTMAEGGRLNPGDSITSLDGRFSFYVTHGYSEHGNLTVARLYRFEPMRDPILMDHWTCAFDQYHQGWVELYHGRLIGTYEEVRADGTRGVVWGFPVGRPPAQNPLLVMKDDGNLVLYERNADDEGVGAAWNSGTAGTYLNAYDPSTDLGIIAIGSISINPNCLLQNQLDSRLTVSDGTQSVCLAPGETAGLLVAGGAGQVKIDLQSSTSYDLDVGIASDGAIHLDARAEIEGSTIAIKRGAGHRLDWSKLPPNNFSHLPLYSRIAQLGRLK